jgi:hypothetical protein
MPAFNEACQDKGYPPEIVNEILKQKNVTKTIDLIFHICPEPDSFPWKKEFNTIRRWRKIGYQHSAIKHAEQTWLYARYRHRA